MKIIEAKNGLLKFETEQDCYITSLYEVKDTLNNYIAQVIKCKSNGAGYTGVAKLIFNYKESLLPYDKKIPNYDSEIIPLPLNVLTDTFNKDNSVILGRFIDDSDNIVVSSDCLNKKTLVISDNNKTTTSLALTLKKQYEKYIIIDADDSVNTDKYIAGVDFKLPLNTEALDFIYNDCLSDATAESKSTIKDIFKDLADYSRTVPFVPFEALKSIVDNMVNNMHIFKLIVLKNKLEKFQKLNYFASTAEEAQKLEAILNSDNAVIDLSKLDADFVNKYLEVIYSKLKNIKNARVFVKMSNSVSKKAFKTMFTSKLPTLFAVNSNYKYIKNIPPLFSNLIIDSDSKIKLIFRCTHQLQNTDGNDMVLCGESTNNIPLIFTPNAEINATEITINTPVETDENNSINEIDTVDTDDNISDDAQEDIEIEEQSDVEDTIEEPEEIEESPFSERSHEDFHTKIDSLKSEILEQEIAQEEISELNNQEDSSETSDLSDIQSDNDEDISSQESEPETAENEENLVVEIEPESFDESLQTEETGVSENDGSIPDYEQDDVSNSVVEPEIISDDESQEIMDVMPIEEQSFEDDSVVELDDTETASDDIIVEMDEDILDDINTEEASPIDQEIVEDVDKVYTTIKDETLSDVDLDLIDELNSIESDETSPIVSDSDDELIINTDDTEELDNTLLEQNDDDSFSEPLTEVSDSPDNSEILETKNTSTPIVPVYDAEIPPEDRVVSDEIEQGDTVVHAKYGTGVVEKMIKYGNKNLYSINFDNVGRRLLDPALTEIKKA